jgi:outer membrane receptor protein involved in Fe transport
LIFDPPEIICLCIKVLATRSVLVGLLFVFSSVPVTSTEEADPSELAVFELTDFVVTGSHFTGDQGVVDLPLTRINGESLQIWNDTSAYNALLEQPFSYGYANSDTQSNGLTGSAGANLRGLGNLNTLTLINGRRAGGNSAVGFQHGGFADLNLVPAAAIREVQVAADGTSVTYGSDAVAGTVNLLLHKDYIGNRIEGSYSNTTDGDAAETSLSFLTGQDLSERTHLVLMGSRFERNAIYARDREISESADFITRGGTDARSDDFTGRINVNGQPLVYLGNSFPGSIGDYQPYSTSAYGYNFNEFAPAIPKFEQASAMAHLSHKLTPQIELWSELLYTETDFFNGLAPAPWTASGALLEIIRESPHLPLADKNSLDSLSYRNEELGNLEALHEREASRLLIGLRGEIHSWDWEAAAMQIKNRLDVTWSGLADSAILANRITAPDASFNPFAANFAIGSNAGFDFDNEAALRAAATTASNAFDESFRSFDFKIGGPATTLAGGDLLALFGAEYRSEEVSVKIDPSMRPGSATALGWTEFATPYEAERSVQSYFVEAFVPLIGDPGSEGSQRLELQFASRYEDYTDESGAQKNRYNTLVYKVGLNYEPVPRLSLRASFSTAFRAPTLNESFSGDGAFLFYNDPLNPDDSPVRVPTVLGANADLEPEKSRVLNLGFYVEPKQVDGLAISTTYYRIETRDAITNNGQDIINDETNNGTSFFRDGGGNLAAVLATRFNASEVVTDGLEYALSYSKQSKDQRWEASIGLNQILSYGIKPSDGLSEIDFLGRLSHPLVPDESVQGPGSIPEFKGYARLAWTRKGLTLGGTVHYIHSLDDNPNRTDDGQPRTIEAWTSLDLIAQYAWPTSSENLLADTVLTIGVENVTDEAPPFAAGAFADGYDSSLYSLEGRRISIRLSRDF